MNEPTLVPKSGTQRMQIGLLHQRMFEESFECLRLFVEARDNKELDWKIRLQAAKVILERVAPALQRIDASVAGFTWSGENESLAQFYKSLVEARQAADADSRIY